ncbi:uncharacterized protein LOC105782690 isoform X2 [Gossypium raimondii]|uniref:Uncharacterized protein n=1 Tax=Gossypium raimondii TaxID=29730 RepID=A0A0D2R3K4_GOSRA|nr:uncharacterized protein LOC105782690 isoform X2 [Gossypium raimondii]KJB13940.1 hypothetical protein B456_002G107700 [Gossypium raimondii]
MKTMQCSMFTSRKKRHHYHPLPFPKPKLLWKCHQKRKKQERLSSRMKRIRSDMKEISEEQEEIKEKQRQEREKFEAIQLECEELKNQTILIAQQTASTQIRLALMLQILKARENLEFDKAVMLTNALREVIARQ